MAVRHGRSTIQMEKITAFEIKSYRKILRLSWTEKVSNEIVSSRIGIKGPKLLQNIKKIKLGFFGHIKRHQSLEKYIKEAKIEDKRGRRRPARR